MSRRKEELTHAHVVPPEMRRQSGDTTSQTSHRTHGTPIGRTYACRSCVTETSGRSSGGAAARRVRHLIATTRHVRTSQSRAARNAETEQRRDGADVSLHLTHLRRIERTNVRPPKLCHRKCGGRVATRRVERFTAPRNPQRKNLCVPKLRDRNFRAEQRRDESDISSPLPNTSARPSRAHPKGGDRAAT